MRENQDNDAGRAAESDGPPNIEKQTRPIRSDRLVYTVPEVANMLGTSTKTVRRLVERNLLKRIRGLRKVLITKTSLLAYLNA